MAKFNIKEDRLQQIINESVAEVIKENTENEDLAGFLGKMYQKGRNYAADFKKKFNAARNVERYKHRDFDPYAEYGEEMASNARNYGARQYATDMYNKTVDRNQNARQWTTDKSTGNQQQNTQQQPLSTTPQQQGPMPNPDVAPQQNQQQQQAQQPNFQQANLNPSRNNTYTQQTQNSAKALAQKNAQFLTQKGFKFVNGQWIYTKDGSNWPALRSQYPDIVQAAKSYAFATRKLQEARKTKLNKIISETVTKYIKGELPTN